MRENLFLLCLIVLVSMAVAVLAMRIIVPSYRNSNNQIYTTKLGHPNVLRKRDQPLPVLVADAKVQKFTINVIGEGVCSSQPTLVPIVPMAIVTEVLVEEGDRVSEGDLLAVLDDSKARLQRDAAELAIATAEAELKRVKLGSAYVLAQERPIKEQLNKDVVLTQKVLLSEKLAKFESAYEKGVISRVKLLEVRQEYAQISERYEQAKLSTVMAEDGALESAKIAQYTVDGAQQALQSREAELEGYRVYAPSDGIVDQVLINPGEVNQESGKPGFLISKSLWFDAYFDQSDYQYIQRDTEAQISLEAYPGKTFSSYIYNIKPIVSFNSGGPEISRPLRPKGSGAPEWAATFKAKLAFTAEDIYDSVITGMTGFARVSFPYEALALPLKAVLSISAGEGIVYVVSEDNTWEVRAVKVGYIDSEKVEILDGLIAGESVIVEGHWVLKEGDEITIQE